MTFPLIALAVSIACLAYVCWNGWQLRKLRQRSEAAARRSLAANRQASGIRAEIQRRQLRNRT